MVDPTPLEQHPYPICHPYPSLSATHMSSPPHPLQYTSPCPCNLFWDPHYSLCPHILFCPTTSDRPFPSFPSLSAEPNGGVLGPKIVAGLGEDCWLRGGVLDLQNWCWICGRASGLGWVLKRNAGSGKWVLTLNTSLLYLSGIYHPLPWPACL